MFAATLPIVLQKLVESLLQASKCIEFRLQPTRYVIIIPETNYIVMSMSGGGDGGGRWDARMDSTLPTNGTGNPEDKEDDAADNATNGDHVPAGSANNVLQTVPNGTTRANPTLLDILRGTILPRPDANVPNENAYVPFNAPASAPRGSLHEIPVSPTSGRHPPGLTARREPGPGYDVVPGTDAPRSGPVAQHQPDEYLRDLDHRQATMIQNEVHFGDDPVESPLFDDPWDESVTSTPIEEILAFHDLEAHEDEVEARLESYDELEHYSAQVYHFAQTLPSRLSERIMARFFEHCQCTVPQTAALAAFVQLVPFLFSMVRSMAAFNIQDLAVVQYDQAVVLLPHAGHLSEPSVSDRAGTVRGAGAALSPGMVPEAATPDPFELMRAFEAMPVLCPASGLALGSPDQVELLREYETMQVAMQEAMQSHPHPATLEGNEDMEEPEAEHASCPASETATQGQPQLVRGSEMMPSSLPAPEPDVLDQAELQREYEAMQSCASSVTLEGDDPVGEREVMPPSSPVAPAGATQDQAESILRPPADFVAGDNTVRLGAAYDANQVGGLAAMHEALVAAQILADMKLEEMLFSAPPSSTDGQPPATFPNASKQFSFLPPPMLEEHALSPADGQPPKASKPFSSLPALIDDRNTLNSERQSSSKPSTDVSVPDATSANELASLRRTRARATSAPFSEFSATPGDGLVLGDYMPADKAADPRDLAERQAGDLCRARVRRETRTCRDRFSWSQRAREVLDDFIAEEQHFANRRWMEEQKWQTRHDAFLRSFFNRESEDMSLHREEEHSRRNSAPAGDCPDADMSALAVFYKMHQRWKDFCESVRRETGSSKTPESPDFHERLRTISDLEAASFLPPPGFDYETDSTRLRYIENLEATNKELHQALAKGTLRLYGKGDPHADTKSTASAEHDDDSSQTPARKKKSKKSKRKAPLKTKKELAEEVQQRIAAQS